jgi:23S rRNA pseudouridine1911/1915/1917 synthase
VRLDQFLAGKEDIKSRAVAQKMIDAGLVRVKGKKVTKASFNVDTSMKIEWDAFPEAEIPADAKSSTKLPILFEDDDCMVVDKPAGISVHPGSGMKSDEETILTALRPIFKKQKLPYSAAEVLVHRLDKETTGCLLIAKNPKAHMALQKQFADRSVDKTYLTLVAGIPSPAAALIDAPIGRHAQQRTTMSIYQATASRSAKTTYRTIGKTDKIALLSCVLHTGRTHQIRVHLRSIGHPVLGDPTYGNAMSEGLAEQHGIDFLCLHAWKLAFKSPSGKKVAVMSPVPKTFSGLLKKLDISVPK